MTINMTLLNKIYEEGKESIWSKLTDITSTILEYVDISMSNIELTIGNKFETPYNSGIVTEQVAEELL